MNRVAIYGAGAFAKFFFEALQSRVDFFIDDYYEGERYLEKSILRLADVSKDTRIYISVLQHSKSIEKKLLKKNFTNVYNFTQSIKAMNGILEIISKSNYLWLVEQKEQMLDMQALLKVEILLSDTKSKNILKQIIKLRQTLDSSYYIEPEGEEYFTDDVPILENLKTVNFVDCGAYTGDTIIVLMQKKKKIASTISFEPDTQNIKKLQLELQEQKQNHPNTNFYLYPAGVYSKNTILKFANSGIASSANIDLSADVQISVVSLDSTILYASPNYIKMDIEGAEKEALLGAKKTLQKYKPNLAICLYHKPEDLWELPLLIQEIEPSYDMYIRVHEDMCLSTVLYCISRSRDV